MLVIILTFGWTVCNPIKNITKIAAIVQKLLCQVEQSVFRRSILLPKKNLAAISVSNKLYRGRKKKIGVERIVQA